VGWLVLGCEVGCAGIAWAVVQVGLGWAMGLAGLVCGGLGWDGLRWAGLGCGLAWIRLWEGRGCGMACAGLWVRLGWAVMWAVLG
jgi:hypothetical protein